jgi:acetyl-CoA C-acetyltransferase
MRFAGGPLNNYVLQATARMAEVLRDDPNSAGLVTCVSGFLNKQGFGVWSCKAPELGFRFADVTEEVAAATQPREVVGDYTGPAVIAGYTVLYLEDRPAKGIAVCDLPDGRRAVASSADRALVTAMTREEFCGREVLIGPGGALLATPA